MSKYKIGDVLLYQNKLKLIITHVYPAVKVNKDAWSIGYYIYNEGELLLIDSTDNDPNFKLSLKHKFKKL